MMLLILWTALVFSAAETALDAYVELLQLIMPLAGTDP
jgi:hypothetical protein